MKKYSEIRNTLKTGDLVAWEVTKISSIFSFILLLYQKIFKVKFSHTGVVLRIGNRIFIVEASPPVVRIYPLSMKSDFYVFNLNLTIKDSHIDELIRNVGKKYSILDLIKGIFGFSTSDKSFYCSELSGKFYKECGLLEDEDDYLTPQKLVETMSKVANKEPEFVIIDRVNLNHI